VRDILRRGYRANVSGACAPSGDRRRMTPTTTRASPSAPNGNRRTLLESGRRLSRRSRGRRAGTLPTTSSRLGRARGRGVSGSLVGVGAITGRSAVDRCARARPCTGCVSATLDACGAGAGRERTDEETGRSERARGARRARAGGRGARNRLGGVTGTGMDTGGAGGATGSTTGSRAGGGGGGGGRAGSSESGSRYPFGSAVSRMPRWTYGSGPSGSPLGPIVPTTSPSPTAVPAGKAIDPRCTRVIE
jgi:hypothetical protein